MNVIVSVLWTAFWALTLWSTMNSVQGCFYMLSDTSNKVKLSDIIDKHRWLTSICWAIIIVFWNH